MKDTSSIKSVLLEVLYSFIPSVTMEFVKFFKDFTENPFQFVENHVKYN